MKVHLNNSLSMIPKLSESVINSLRDQICLIDSTGIIFFVNEEWNRFALRNGGDISETGVGTNYLRQCKQVPALYKGLESVLSGQVEVFNFEYPCHSPTVKRWFLLQATPLQENEDIIEGVVIRHVNITKQKLLELQLKEYAEKDPLTSLFNRRYFEERLKSHVDDAIQQGTYLSLLYIDVDNFKEINDVYGHPIGDEVLKQLALQIMDMTRLSDTAARIGGDEFALLLPNIDKEELECIGNKLSKKIQQLRIHDQSLQLSITVSIGGKSFIAGSSIKSMYKCADQALYLAKNRGKNKVVIM